MNIPVREGETIEGSRTTRNRPYPVLKCSGGLAGGSPWGISMDALGLPSIAWGLPMNRWGVGGRGQRGAAPPEGRATSGTRFSELFFSELALPRVERERHQL